MLITKGGITREIAEKDLQSYRGKGYAVIGIPRPTFSDAMSKAPAEKAEKPLDRLNKADLEAKAAELGIEIPEGATKKIIIGLIEAMPEEILEEPEATEDAAEALDDSEEVLEGQEGGE